MTVTRLTPAQAPGTIDLLDQLRVSLFGIASRRLHSALVRDGLRQLIDVRVAVEAGCVRGVLLAAPASYWWLAPLRHAELAWECVCARLARRATRRADPTDSTHPPDPPQQAHPTHLTFCPGPPPRSWVDAADAWRIIFVGTAAGSRGKGIGAALYRSVMADRSLVARIAADNAPSLRLHESLGWRLYRDGQVVLAVHLRGEEATRREPARAAPPRHEAVR